jgi:alkaline phosphatase
MKYIFTFALCFAQVVYAQENSSMIFSHNDYLQEKPFETAYNLAVGYVEADVFLREGKLMVAHTSGEINPERTLGKLYLDPINVKIKNNAGNIYPDGSRKLTLMIDLKSEGIATLNAIVEHLKTYPDIVSCNTLTIAISGNVPDTSQWKHYPRFITFDGRPGKQYSWRHLQRISFISDNFRKYSMWNGKRRMTNSDLKKITSVMAFVHAQGKKIRFWGAPDVPNSWEAFQQLGIEIIGTDNIIELDKYLRSPR